MKEFCEIFLPDSEPNTKNGIKIQTKITFNVFISKKDVVVFWIFDVVSNPMPVGGLNKKLLPVELF